jgi:hypothetical protein
VVRSLAASALAFLVPFGASVAPFVHAHADDHHSSHHDGRQVHAHLSPHAAPRAADHAATTLADDDAERAVDVPLFVAVETLTFNLPVLAPARMELDAPLAVSLSSRPRVAHAHDPPASSSLAPRAPPAFLFLT